MPSPHIVLWISMCTNVENTTWQMGQWVPQLCRTSRRWVCKLSALLSVTGSRSCLCPRWRTPGTITLTWSLLGSALTFWISSSLMSSALCVSLTQPWPRNSSITFWALVESSSIYIISSWIIIITLSLNSSNSINLSPLSSRLLNISDTWSTAQLFITCHPLAYLNLQRNINHETEAQTVFSVYI